MLSSTLAGGCLREPKNSGVFKPQTGPAFKLVIMSTTMCEAH